MPVLYIDNKPFEVKAGKNLLETCLTLGMDLPYFCWHPSLGSVGACRQCAVKVYKDENDTTGRLIMSCMEPVTDNQRISIKDLEAVEFREHVIEWLMTNHPHDCAVCDEGGSCHLQDMTVMTGHTYRNYNYKKRTYRNQYLGPFINHEMNRCIQCYRCVRFYKDYAGGTDLDAFASRNQVYFGRHEEGVLENEFSGNLAEVCPTGVFTDKTLKEHYTRKWDLTMAPSICHHCSLGCNIIGGERYGGLRMIANRYHGDINGYFLCDRGRFGYEFVNADDRIREPMLNGEVVEREKWLTDFALAAKGKKVIGIGSARASLESNFALKKLVGDGNFYVGVSDQQKKLNDLAYKILKETPAQLFSMKEVEKSDAVFVLGEDLTNTASMLALAVRQAVRQEPIEAAEKMKIPLWNDAAVRGLIQDKKGPCYVASVTATKLDDVCKQTFHAAPQDLARLGYAVAHYIDSSAPAVKKLTEAAQALAKQIADDLIKAKQPVIISGTSSSDADVMKAAANISKALHAKNKKAGIVLTLPECNSLGTAILGGRDFSEALSTDADVVIVLENDLYRNAAVSQIDTFIKGAKEVVVIDHTINTTTRNAKRILPAGSFAEADGTLVNNEGRMQRFFQVYQPQGNISESWRWIVRLAKALGNQEIGGWKNIDSIIESISKEVTALKEIESVSPKASFRVNGQKIPRAPHRFSGRTATNAHLEVSELKPVEDPDSLLSYTMEGLQSASPTNVIPFFWSPGWNSVQSVNKYQEEVGGPLREGNPGIKLIKSPNSYSVYYDVIPEPFEASKQNLLSVPIHHIFGSEELSAKSAAVSKRVPSGYVAISKADAETKGLINGDQIEIVGKEGKLALPLKIETTLPTGVIGIPVGLEGVGFVSFLNRVEIKKL